LNFKPLKGKTKIITTYNYIEGHRCKFLDKHNSKEHSDSPILDLVKAKQIEIKENNRANAIVNQLLSILGKSTTPPSNKASLDHLVH
jgi:hypothetical protein